VLFAFGAQRLRQRRPAVSDAGRRPIGVSVLEAVPHTGFGDQVAGAGRFWFQLACGANRGSAEMIATTPDTTSNARRELDIPDVSGGPQTSVASSSRHSPAVAPRTWCFGRVRYCYGLLWTVALGILGEVDSGTAAGVVPSLS
jgi:hypothetical protein